MRFRFLALALLSVLASGASAQITVTSTADTQADDGVCTLREALTSVNTLQASGGTAGECRPGVSTGATTITMEVPAGSTITLASDLPTVQRPISMSGPTPEASGLTLDGGGQFHVLAFNTDSPGTPTTLRRMTVTGSVGRFGGGIAFNTGDDCVLEDLAIHGNRSTNAAGGLFLGRNGTCTVNRIHVYDNQTDGSGGGVWVAQSANVTLRNSTIAGNTAAGGGGGLVIIFNVGPPGTFIMEQTTVSGNIAGSSGGGISYQGSGTTIIRGSAVVFNESRGPSAFAGGINASGAMTFESSIIAGNETDQAQTRYTDFSGSNGQVSLGGNLIGISSASDPNFPSGIPNANGDLVGTAATPFRALLGPLADNGGTTPTHLPTANSPVLDAGICPAPSASSGADQRGSVREIDETGVANANGDACDIGPVEGRAFTVDAEPLAQRTLRLDAPTPNPARGLVRLAFETAASGAVSLTVVDLLGREVAVLARGPHAAGEHTATLDTAPLAPGVYVVRLVMPEASAVQQITVVR